MKTIPGIALALSLAASAQATDNGFARAPYADERQAVEQLVKHKTPAARRYLAWIRHDHAIALVHSYQRTKSLADIENGIKYARSATELAPGVAEFWRVLAMAALAFPQGATTGIIAEGALNRVLELEPNDRPTRRLLADVYVGTREYADAARQYEILLAGTRGASADFDTAKMAYACMEGDVVGRCRLALEKAVQKRPNSAQARIALAILYRSLHLETKARDQLDRVAADAMANDGTRAVARQLKAHWDKAGPMRNAPDPDPGEDAL